jgi:hypothetical protein
MIPERNKPVQVQPSTDQDLKPAMSEHVVFLGVRAVPERLGCFRNFTECVYGKDIYRKQSYVEIGQNTSRAVVKKELGIFGL